jgi:hypothetical protein
VTVTDVLPPGVNFVSADTPQGTWTEDAGVVTFHLGALEDVFLQLTVTVTPTQPGSITNTVRLRGNESEQSINNNIASVTVQVQGTAITTQSQTGSGASQAALALFRTQDGLVLIEVQGSVGARFTLESSEDLVTWSVRTEFTTTAPVTRFTERAEGSATFYRVKVAAPAVQ